MTISSKTSIDAGQVSNYLPPWLDIQIASAPTSLAFKASSGFIMPLMTNGNYDSFLNSFTFSQLNEPSTKFFKKSAWADFDSDFAYYDLLTYLDQILNSKWDGNENRFL